MDKLLRYRVFAQVAEMRSFIKAAHALELPRATVSAAVQELEAELGTRLLHRTTRQVQPTTDGTQLLERLRQLLADAEDVQAMFRGRHGEVSGQLNVDLPSRIARRLVAPALPELLRRHPRLRLGLGSSDRAIDLVQEGVDCAVRVGELHDSSLVLRPLGRLALVNCASPDYLREHGTPRQPAELAQGHLMVGYASPGTGREQAWEYLAADGTPHELALPSRVLANNAESYIALSLAGLGLIQIPRFDVQHLLAAGRLAEVLPAHRPAPMPVSLLYPHRQQRSHRLQVFIEWFEALLRPCLEPPDTPA